MHPTPAVSAKATTRCCSSIHDALSAGAPPTEDHTTKAEYTPYPCFTPRREIYVLHREFGRVTEISMDGVRFSYFDQAFFSTEPPAKGMLFTNTDEYLDEIPFHVVGDKSISHLFASKHFLKERKVRFGELSANQVRKLERFILKNAHIPQLSFDARYADYKSIHAPGL